MPDSSCDIGHTYTIILLPQRIRLHAREGENLLHLLVRRGYPLPSACGGQGSCGKCKLLIREGRRPPTEPERIHLSQAELAQGWRLACQQWIDRDLVLELPSLEGIPQAKERLKGELQVALDPGIEKVYLELPPPGRGDQRPDVLRLQEGLGRDRDRRLSFPLSVLRRLPGVLREGNFKITLTLEGERVLNIEPGKVASPPLGLALDLGTATLAGYLLDLATGRELALRSLANPQGCFGADVISRIRHVRERGEEGLRELQEAVVSGVNTLIRRLCRAAEAEPAQIYKVTVVGNPTMVHLFLGIDPRGIDHSPYIPVLRDGLILRAKELGLEVNPEAGVYVLPAVSGYVGADITAGVLFCGLHRREELALFVDLGTNAEIVLGNKEKLLACSTPAGPAFEGAQIKHGMSALPGAISHAHLDGDRLKLEVIGGGPPKGICGSGLIDLAAELLKARLIDPQGRLLPGDSPLGRRVTLDERGQPRFLVSEVEGKSIYLTQQDVRELQLAKGAIRAGVELILREWGATPDEVERVYLAGAFGNYVRRESVLTIGLLPPFPVEKLQPVGNAAGQGAKLALLNREAWKELQRLAERMDYLELSYRPDFNEAFIRSLHFPDPSRVALPQQT